MTSREQLLVARPTKRTDDTSELSLISYFGTRKARDGGSELQEEEIVISITLCNC